MKTETHFPLLEDPLAASRGICNGLAIAAVFWLVVGALFGVLT